MLYSDDIVHVTAGDSAEHSPGLRIVSLVPSLTELIFALGLGDRLVGRTHYCIHPADRIGVIPSVGGTKKIRVDRLRALRPSHVLLNVDENPRELAEQLDFVPHRVITHPQTPHDNITLYQHFGELFDAAPRADRLARALALASERLAATSAARPRRRVIYLIWREPWMSVARDTYIGQTLALAGLDVWPPHDGGPTGAGRYPEIAINRPLLDEVDRVLFSSEPFQFGPEHLREFAEHHGSANKLRLIDGEMTSWYGSRAIAGLRYLRRLQKTL